MKSAERDLLNAGLGSLELDLYRCREAGKAMLAENEKLNRRLNFVVANVRAIPPEDPGEPTAAWGCFFDRGGWEYVKGRDVS